MIGRVAECARLDRLLDAARAGRSGALLLHGEAGVGKSTLLTYAVESAADFAVVRAAGVQSEAELAFAGLHSIAGPLLVHIEALPDTQASALRGALALGPATGASRLTVAAATLGLLAAAAAEAQPLLVAVDDLQWLDRASADALLFAVRRLHAERVAVLLVTRDDVVPTERVRDIPELPVAGMGAADVEALLGSLAAVVPDRAVAERLQAATDGNPLALAEVAGTLSPGQLQGTEALTEPVPIGPGLQHVFRVQAAALGPAVATALLVAAAAGDALPEAVARAITLLGADPSGLERAEDAGLLRLGHGAVEFRHPLVRSAIYHGAPPSARRAAHRTLADVLSGRDDERAAWQLAAASVGPDERAAAGLDAAADHAFLRGAAAAAAAAWERAAQLSTGQPDRQRRLARAAESALQGGSLNRAAKLLDAANEAQAEPRVAAQLTALRGRVCRLRGQARAAHDLLADAGLRLAEIDSSAAVVLLAEAVGAAVEGGALAAAVQTARLMPALADDVGKAVFLADLELGLTLGYEDPVAGGQLVRRATTRLAADPELAAVPRYQLSAANAHAAVGQLDLARPHVERAVRLAREQGALGTLPEALAWSAWLEHMTGNWRRAYALAVEALDLAREAGQEFVGLSALEILTGIESAQGRVDLCRSHVEEALEISERLELPLLRLMVSRHAAVLDLGIGRLSSARERLTQLVRFVAETGLIHPYESPLPDLLEVHLRSGEREQALALLPLVDACFTGHDGPMPLSRAARCRGLVADDSSFDVHFAESIRQGEQGGVLFQLARTRLCYGERLRRSRRRKEAREQLYAAIELFDRLEADPWAARARGELQATGETVRRRGPGEEERLTPQELQVALLVAEGRPSRDIGRTLFLSTRTVEFHLSRVYRKLGLSSRGELIRRFATAAPGHPEAANSTP